jgi:hypothetical protein
LKSELEGDVRPRVLIVVDLDLIHDRWVEREVVRSIARLEKRVDVHDECDSIWMIVADKQVEISDVSCMIQGGDRRFSVTRGKCAWWKRNQQTSAITWCSPGSLGFIEERADLSQG